MEVNSWSPSKTPAWSLELIFSTVELLGYEPGVPLAGQAVQLVLRQ